MALKKDIIEAEFRTTGGNKLHAEIGKTAGEIKRLNKENEMLMINKKKMEAQNKKGTKAWHQLNDQMKKNKVTINEEKTKLTELNSKLKVTEMTSRMLAKRKSELARQLNNTSKAINPKEWNRLNKELKKVDSQYKKVRVGGSGVGSVMKKMGALLPIAGFAALFGLLKKTGAEMLNLAKIIQGDAIRSTIVFGDSLGYVEEQAEELANKMGLTNREFVAAAAATADLLIPLDFNREKAADMSVELQSLAGALDEWTGGQLGAKEVSEILTKAMLGENEQLKQLGIAIKMDSLEFRNLVKEKINATGATKAQAQAMATLELIQKKSADAQSAYNMQGNKLLRTQKRLSVWTKNLKERFIGLSEVPLSKSLQEQNKQANILAVSLADSNITIRDRLQLLGELEIIAPSIAEGLEAENLNYKELRKSVKAYNEEMADRIMIASLDEDEQKIAARLAKSQSQMDEAKLHLAESVAWYDNMYNKTLGSEEGSLLDKVLKIREEVGGVYYVDIYLKRYKKAVKKLVEATKNSQAFDSSKDNLLRIMGIDPDESPAAIAEEVVNRAKPITDEVVKRMIAELEKDNNQELTVLKQQFLNKEIEHKEYEEMIYQLKLVSLEKEKALRIKAGKDISDIDVKIVDLQIEHMERGAAELKRINAQEVTDKADSMKIWLADLDTMYQADLLKLKEQLQNKEITQQEYEDRVLEMKIEYMMLELAFRNEAGENTTILQGQLMDMEFQLMDRRKQRLMKDNIEIGENHKKLFEKMQSDIRRVSDVINSMLEKKRSAIASAKEMYDQDVAHLKKKLDEGQISYAEYTNQLSDLREKHYTAEKKAQKDFQRDFLMMLLEQLRNILYIKIAEIWANEIASKSYWGLITAAALTVAVEGAYSLAKSKLSGGGSYHAGGSTGLGGKYEPAGVVHKNEYVIPEEGYFNPNLRPFINVIEEARQSGTLRNLTMGGVPIGQNVRSQPVGSEQGFAAGGPTSPPEGNQGSGDQQLSMLMSANLALLQKLDREGVLAYIGDKQVREFRDRINEIESIERSVSKQ